MRTARYNLLMVGRWVVCLLPLAIGWAPGAAHANLLRNGSFEDASVAPNPVTGWARLYSGSTAITRWKVIRTIDYMGASFWEASHGSRSVEFNGGGPGSIQQSFSTVAGRAYRATFDLAGDVTGGPALKRLRVEAAGQSAVFVFDKTGHSRESMGWEPKAWAFTATGSNTTLKFSSLTTESSWYGPVLDNVQVAPLGPDLSWLGTSGFLTDGVDPNKGVANGTLFAFKVKLTDQDGDEPNYVQVILDKDGLPWRTVDLVARPGTTQDGRVYGIKRKLPRGNWTYRFIAEDEDGMAEGEPTLPHPGPKMPSPPYLLWAQEPGYGDGDGVEPNSGYDMVDREFKVVYRDHEGDLPRHVKVALWRDGGWYGQFAMTPPPPPLDPAAGLLYTLTKKLQVGTYQYRFRAADRHGTARGPASVKTGGLEVIAAAPILSWTGEDGYKTDGVAPNKGLADNTMFRFRVKLTDPDNDEPEHVRLILRKDGVSWRTINMRAEAGPTMSGRMYAASTKLPVGNYAYRVAARDEDGRAEGDPATVRPGPIMPAPPFLLFSSDPGYENKDGVKPNTGQANDTVFRFKCIYKSHDGDAPAWVRVRLWRNGAFHKVYQLAARGSTKDPVVGGIVYGAARRLPAGAYAYRFEGQDWKGEKAIGPGTAKLSGLTVHSAGATAITSLSAAPTNAGTQITVTLASSAEVTARILNIAGRPVKTLCRGKACDAGANTLLWNAQSDSGLAVPNGTYLVEVTAKAGDGSEARALTQVRLDR